MLYLAAMMPTPEEAARLREQQAKLRDFATRAREPQIPASR
ncbi:hypothetical protein [Kitasatospora indigofera]